VAHCPRNSLVAPYYLFRHNGVITKYEASTFVEDQHHYIYERSTGEILRTDGETATSAALLGEPAAPSPRRLTTSCGWLIFHNHLVRGENASFSEAISQPIKPPHLSARVMGHKSKRRDLQANTLGSGQFRLGRLARQENDQGDGSPATAFDDGCLRPSRQLN
jgi:hypothetical protein